MSYKVERIQDVLDKGKRSWNKNGDAGGDADIFLTEFVIPLRQLKNEGLFEDLREHRGSYRGQKLIDLVSIGGAINLEFDTRD